MLHITRAINEEKKKESNINLTIQHKLYYSQWN